MIRLVVQGGPYAGVSRAEVLRRVRAMLEAVRMQDTELSVLLTGDNQIQALNSIYRKKQRPTDVLAFSQREGPAGPATHLLGDVVVSVPTASRQARARRWDLLSEVTMLLAHGLLHLLGWDHQSASADRRMRRETRRLCAIAAEESRAGSARTRGSRVIKATSAREKAVFPLRQRKSGC